MITEKINIWGENQDPIPSLQGASSELNPIGLQIVLMLHDFLNSLNNTCLLTKGKTCQKELSARKSFLAESSMDFLSESYPARKPSMLTSPICCYIVDCDDSYLLTSFASFACQFLSMISLTSPSGCVNCLRHQESVSLPDCRA